MSDLLTLFDIAEPTPKPEEECKGLIYRGRVNEFFNANGDYIEKKTMSPLKRKSCKGCEKCDWLTDDANEQLGCRIPLEMPEIIDGNMYQLKVTSYSRDWESGLVDDWEVGFVDYVEPVVEETLYYDATKVEATP